MGESLLYLSFQTTLIARKASSLKPIQLVLSYARHYKLVLVVTIVSTLLLVGVQLVVPWVIRDLINEVTASNVTSESFKVVTTLSLVVLGVYILKGIM